MRYWAKAIRHIGQALDRGAVDATLHVVRADPRQDGVRHRTVEPRDGHAIGIEAGAEADSAAIGR